MTKHKATPVAATVTGSVAVHRAIALLEAAGVQYLIVGADGTHLGPLAQKVNVLTDRQTARRDGVSAMLREKYKWPEKLQALEPGQNLVIACESPEEGRRLATNMTARAAHMWGNGAHISSRTGAVVEILRVS